MSVALFPLISVNLMVCKEASEARDFTLLVNYKVMGIICVFVFGKVNVLILT